MRTLGDSEAQADRIAAWATGAGVGLVTLMVAWLVGNRLLSVVLDAPEGPTAAFIVALVLGAFATAVAGRRCLRTANHD